ncbi:conserved protein of unknown function [Xenorhabdus doucetiae]|uniref:Uncharacterized protein n=1 Tax=Xenorhabdus doucetiae TaxID=351671 RepID=A0A068QP59_9GAMM|nr:conserved protein of unknown function [Xenorhabdus doucetiae]
MPVAQKYCCGNLSFTNKTWRDLHEIFKDIIQFIYYGMVF